MKTLKELRDMNDAAPWSQGHEDFYHSILDHLESLTNRVERIEFVTIPLQRPSPSESSEHPAEADDAVAKFIRPADSSLDIRVGNYPRIYWMSFKNRATLNDAVRHLRSELRQIIASQVAAATKAKDEEIERLEKELNEPCGVCGTKAAEMLTDSDCVVCRLSTQIEQMISAQHGMTESQIRALIDKNEKLEAANAALQPHAKETEHLRQRVLELTEACRESLHMTGHNHWDATMSHGAGCPLCIQQREICQRINNVIAKVEGTTNAK